MRNLISDTTNRRLVRAAVLLGLIYVLAGPASKAERFPARTYTSADGLGSSFVNSLMLDSRGFLWVCTRDGLSRFDGSRFVTYQLGDKSTSPAIEQILETRKGIYWIVTTGGLYRFDPTSVSGLTPTDRPALNAQFVSNQRGVLYEDHDGGLWIGGGHALFRIEETKETPVFQNVGLRPPANSSIALSIDAIHESLDRSLWLVTNWGVVRRWPDGKEIIYDIDTSRTNRLTSIEEDSTGRIWVGRVKGVYVIKPEPREEPAVDSALTLRHLDQIASAQTGYLALPEKPGEIFAYPNPVAIPRGPRNFVYQTRDRHIWISSGSGLVEFDGQAFHSHTIAQDPLQESGGMVEDVNGNLWFGGSNGLVRLNRGGLTSFGQADGFGNPYILVINQTVEDKVYALTGDLSLSFFDRNILHTVRPQLTAGSQGVWTANPVFQDSAGEWWFLTSEKLYRFAATNDLNTLASERPRATYDRRDGLKGDQLFHIFEDSHHDLLISTHGADSSQSGLTRWSRATEKFYSFTEADGFPSNHAVSSFAEDKQGHLWFGFYEGGLVRYDDGRFVEFTPAAGFPTGLISALYLDLHGRLWAGFAQSGLGRLDDTNVAQPHFVIYSTDNGLASNNVRTITEDLYGNIYAGTARGIDRLNPETSLIKHYSTSDGLAGDFVTTAFRDHSGAVWFGTPNGLSRLLPAPDKPQPASPVWISGLRIAGERRPVGELGSTNIPAFENAHTQNSLQIDFFGIDFNAGEGLRYQYMLEGADPDWSAPTLLRTVNYANLAPGAYRFRVRAVNAAGVTSTTPAIVSFKILPPFWRRWWFLVLAALIVGGFVFTLDRYRVARVKELDAALGESQIAEQAARESEERFRTLAETASDAIITVDEHSTIVFVNAATETIFGYSRDEMTGADLTMLMPEYFRKLHRAGLGNYLQSGRKHISWEAVELPGLHKSGREIPLELSFGEFTRNGQRYFTGIARDITERKRAEEALQHAREERMRELERVRKRIASDLHDDIGSSLTQISLLSEVAQQRLGNEGSSLSEPLAMIANSSRELVDSMSDIVWAINPKKDHLSDLSQRMRTLAIEVFTASNIRFRFQAPEDGDELRIGANLRREVFLIFKESINNIAKHSGCTNASVEFRADDRMLFLSVSDDGCGFDTTIENEGHGLVSMRERSREMVGTLEMVSGLGAGTTITLQVQLGAPTGD